MHNPYPYYRKAIWLKEMKDWSLRAIGSTPSSVTKQQEYFPIY